MRPNNMPWAGSSGNDLSLRRPKTIRVNCATWCCRAITIACRSLTFVGSGSGLRETFCCLACLGLRRFKVLHFVEGKYEVFHNFDALLYDKTVALCKRKIIKRQKKTTRLFEE